MGSTTSGWQRVDPRTPPKTGVSPLSVRIDRTRCDGRGYCAELLPEMIRLDDWGYPIVAPGTVPERLLGHARRAVDSCPLLAIRLDGARRMG